MSGTGTGQPGEQIYNAVNLGRSNEEEKLVSSADTHYSHLILTGRRVRRARQHSQVMSGTGMGQPGEHIYNAGNLGRSTEEEKLWEDISGFIHIRLNKFPGFSRGILTENLDFSRGKIAFSRGIYINIRVVYTKIY